MFGPLTLFFTMIVQKTLFFLALVAVKHGGNTAPSTSHSALQHQMEITTTTHAVWSYQQQDASSQLQSSTSPASLAGARHRDASILTTFFQPPHCQAFPSG